MGKNHDNFNKVNFLGSLALSLSEFSFDGDYLMAK
jgi:hypothetical protein